MAIANVHGLIAVFAIANDGQVYYIQQVADDVFGNWTQITAIDSSVAAGTRNLVLARVRALFSNKIA